MFVTRLLTSSVLLAAVAASTIARAANCPVTCTGSGPHDAALALAVACAGPDGTVVVDGDCQLHSALVLSQPRMTLSGGCGAALSRILPAPSPAPGASTAAIVVAAGASGSTIRDLTIRGVGDGIATSPASATAAAGQPDDVRIVNCQIEAGRELRGSGILHFAQNGPPFNDVDRCTGLPAGIATGWQITDNFVRTADGNGISVGGNGFLVARNQVQATVWGIALVNRASTAVVQPFGAPPSNHDNVVADNVVAVTSTASSLPAEVPVGLADIGFTDAPLAAPSADGCERGFNTEWTGNCVTVTPDGGPGRDYAVGIFLSGNGNADGSASFADNRVLTEAPLAGDPLGNVGVETAGSRYALVDRNDFSGAGDFPFLSLREDAEGNHYSRNRFGPAFNDEPHFVHDFGLPESSCYAKNQYCDAHEVFEGEGVDLACSRGNKAGKTCGGIAIRCPLPPARPICASSAAPSTSRARVSARTLAQPRSSGLPGGQEFSYH